MTGVPWVRSSFSPILITFFQHVEGLFAVLTSFSSTQLFRAANNGL